MNLEELSIVNGAVSRAFFNVLTTRSILEIPGNLVELPEGWECSFFDSLVIGAGPFNKKRNILIRTDRGEELSIELGAVTHPEREDDGGPIGPPTPPSGSGVLEAKAA